MPSAVSNHQCSILQFCSGCAYPFVLGLRLRSSTDNVDQSTEADCHYDFLVFEQN